VSILGEEAVKNLGLALGSGSTGAGGAAGGSSGLGAEAGLSDEEAAGAGAAGTAAGACAKEEVVPRVKVMANAATTECNDKTMLLKFSSLV
jgi:hypothetical protein